MAFITTLLTLFTIFATSASPLYIDTTHQLPQFHNAALHAGADPYVFYDMNSSLYYAYSTEGADTDSLFAIYSSPDLSTWHRHKGGALKACYDEKANPIPGGQVCWAQDWHWAPEIYHNQRTGWYFFFFSGRIKQIMAKNYFRYSKFEEPSKLGVAVSRLPTGPFHEIESRPLDYYPFDPDYYDVNLVMDENQMLPPQSLDEGQKAPMGTYIPTIDPNVLFDSDGRIYLYTSRNAYRNWVWDYELEKYIEESNIIVVELSRSWWDDPDASTMPEIVDSQINVHHKNTETTASLLYNLTSYNGTGDIGYPPRKDGWKTVISYAKQPQEWENFHVNDFQKYNGTRKDRRWAEGSTMIRRASQDGSPVYILTYSANNYEASNYGVGFATAESPLGPFQKSRANPILSQMLKGEKPVYSTGHGSIVASPPRKNSHKFGAQEVTIQTPGGSELFYVHHARNHTSQYRSMYSTRMTINESAIYVGSDDAIKMHYTSLDQPLPEDTYPIHMNTECLKNCGQKHRYYVRVASKGGGPFDITERSNRVVAASSNVEAVFVREDSSRAGWFEIQFEGSPVYGLAYQRVSFSGEWVTVAQQMITCSWPGER